MNVGKRIRLFDMNGTIRNDFFAVLKSVNDVLRNYGMEPLTVPKYRQSARPDYWEIYRALGFPDSERDSVDRLFALEFKKYSGQVKAFPDAFGTIKQLKERGRMIGIVSNLTHETLDRHVDEYGLKGLVDVVVSREDAAESKPSPKPLLVAFNRLGIPPEQGSYVGDQTWDVMAAKAAGTSSIAISRQGSYHSKSMLEAANPDRVIDKLPTLLYLDPR